MAQRRRPKEPWQCPDWLGNSNAPDPAAATLVPWDSVRAALDEIDGMFFHIAVQAALDCFEDQACACERCGRLPRELFWLAVDTLAEDLHSASAQVGWLTICQDCRAQVSFIPDAELTNLEAEERRPKS